MGKGIERIKQLIEKWKLGKDSLIILILGGALLFIIALPIKPSSSSDTSNTKSQVNTSNTGAKEGSSSSVQSGTGNLTQSTANYKSESELYIEELEARLEALLSSVEGVGNVKVMITMKSSMEQVVEKDVPNTYSHTQETDAEGGNRTVSDGGSQESTIFTTDETGNQVPYITKILTPDIEGVLVVAQGGNNSTINKNITEAIQALFGIEAHKIKVVKMKS